jgi:hypothetical protein
MESTMSPSKKWSLALLALTAGLLTAGSAFAWGGHGHRSHVFVGFNFGFPAYYPAPYYSPYYYPTYYYPPAPVYYSPVIVQSPPVYTERQDVAPAAQTQSYWYYCSAAKGYYPYVKDCPGGWQKVPSVPPG